MKKMLLSLSLGALIAAVPAFADPGGKSHEKSNSAAAQSANPGKSHKEDKIGKPDKAKKGPDETKNHGSAGNFSAKNDRGPDDKRLEKARKDYAKWDDKPAKAYRNDKDNRYPVGSRDDDRDKNGKWARPERRDFNNEPYEITQAGRYFGFSERDRRRLVEGCPPGLAKKRNGCMPPGLAKKRDRDNIWDRIWRRDNRDDSRYFYRDGYLMRYDGDRLLGYRPLLGGALSVGSLFPRDYRSTPISDYYANFFGDDDEDHVYRYSDGVIYALDPKSYAITEVAGLITGDDFTIGEPLPAGYSVYNVPYGYRDRYADGPDANYRYSDGYIYRVDPQTQLIRAAIQLLS